MITDSVTLGVIKSLQDIAVQLYKIETREDKIELFNILSTNIDTETYIFLALVYKRENEYKTFMNHILSLFPEFSGRKPYDFSKDSLFYFTLASWSDDKIPSRELRYLLDSEMIRYFTLESHNPAYEQLNNYECSDNDIRVYALSWLTRNIQVRGEFDLLMLNLLKPSYSKGDNKRKQDIYRGAWMGVNRIAN